RYRQSLPNYEYQMPPPLTERINPYELSLEDVQAFLASSEKPEKDKLAKLFPSKFYGFSPLMGRELAYQVAQDVNVAVADVHADELFFAIQGFMKLLQKREWQPGIAIDDGIVDAFSVYPLTHMDSWQRTESISEAMTEYYGAAVGEEAYEQ